MKSAKPKKQPAPAMPMTPAERREAMRKDFGRRMDAENRGRKR